MTHNLTFTCNNRLCAWFGIAVFHDIFVRFVHFSLYSAVELFSKSRDSGQKHHDSVGQSGFVAPVGEIERPGFFVVPIVRLEDMAKLAPDIIPEDL